RARLPGPAPPLEPLDRDARHRAVLGLVVRPQRHLRRAHAVADGEDLDDPVGLEPAGRAPRVGVDELLADLGAPGLRAPLAGSHAALPILSRSPTTSSTRSTLGRWWKTC